MKSIFYLLSVLVIGAAGYFAWDNLKKIENEIAVYDQTRQTRLQVQNTIAETTEKLEDTEDALDKAKNLNSELIARKQNEESQYNQLRKELEEYEAEIEAHDARLKQLAEVQQQIQDALQDVDIPWPQIPSEITKLKDERKRRGDDLAQLLKLVEKLEAGLQSKQDELNRLNGRMDQIRTRIARNSKVGTVTAVNMDFGFIVVNLGENNSNITPRSDVLVTRNGHLLGRFKPTSVEPVQTVCDLNVKDLTPGVMIQPGDQVLLANSAGS